MLASIKNGYRETGAERIAPEKRPFVLSFLESYEALQALLQTGVVKTSTVGSKQPLLQSYAVQPNPQSANTPLVSPTVGGDLQQSWYALGFEKPATMAEVNENLIKIRNAYGEMSPQYRKAVDAYKVIKQAFKQK